MGAKRLNKTGANLIPDSPGGIAAARWFFLLLVVLAVPSLPAMFARGLESGHTLGSYSWLWLILLSGAILLTLVEAGLLALLCTRASRRLANFAQSLCGRLAKLGWLNGLGLVAAWAG